MSGSGLVVNLDRRRAGSIGMEERALSSLEKFVELCDKGLDEHEEDSEQHGNLKENEKESVSDSSVEEGENTMNNNEVTSPAGSESDDQSGGKSRKEKSSSPEATTNNNNPVYGSNTSLGSTSSNTGMGPKRRSVGDITKAKLCELFIDRSLVETRAKHDLNGGGSATNVNNNGGSKNSDSTNGGAGEKPVTKKSEEIWVKRVNDPGRRSFRITVSDLYF